MRTKNIIAITFSGIYLILSVVVLLIMYFEVPRSQEGELKEIFIDLSQKIKQNQLKSRDVKHLPKEKFFVIWYEYEEGKWHPLIYDKKYFNLDWDDYQFSDIIPQELIPMAHYYSASVNGINFRSWINKSEPEFYIKKILYALASLVFIYLVILFLITVFFKTKDDYFFLAPGKEEAGPGKMGKDPGFTDPVEQAASADPVQDDGSPEMKKKLNQKKIMQEYKDLWEKNFKISPHFKQNFPFYQLNDLLQFSTKPDYYLQQGLKIASDFFNWQNAELYIYQNNHFIENATKKQLDEANIQIPQDGTAKGQIFIPLFPYHKKNIFGYLVFDWNNEELFHISDILYFLKFLFSEDAKYIFIYSNRNKKIKNDIESELQNNLFCQTAFFKVDKKDEIVADMEEDVIKVLNSSIYHNLKDCFIDYEVFEIFPFHYGLYGVHEKSEALSLKLENFIFDEEMHNYFIAHQLGNIAVTFSCGQAVSHQNNLSQSELVERTEANLQQAIQQGGNQLIFE